MDYEGDVTLQCDVATSYPEGLTITWSTTAEDKNLTVQTDAIVDGVSLYTSNVTLSSVTQTNEGTYTCMARNEGGPASDSVNITVSGNRSLTNKSLYISFLSLLPLRPSASNGTG